MTDGEPPRRRILTLKPGAVPTRPLGPQPLTPLRPARPPRPSKPAPVQVVVEPAYGWKCKPCGQGFDLPPDATDVDSIRCPSCNARLGLLGDFRQAPLPNRVRARPIRR